MSKAKPVDEVDGGDVSPEVGMEEPLGVPLASAGLRRLPAQTSDHGRHVRHRHHHIRLGLLRRT